MDILTYNKVKGSDILGSYAFFHISCEFMWYHATSHICLSVVSNVHVWYTTYWYLLYLYINIHFRLRRGIIQDSSRESSGYIAERRQRGTWGPILQKGTAVRHLDLYDFICIHILVYMDFMWICIGLGWWWLSVHKCLSCHCENPALFPLLSIHGGIHCLLLR